MNLSKLRNLDLSDFVLPYGCIESILKDSRVHIWGVVSHGAANIRIHEGKYEDPELNDDLNVSDDIDSPGVTTSDSNNLPRKRDWYWVSGSEL